MQRKKKIKPVAIDINTLKVLELEKEINIHSVFKNTINVKTNHGMMVFTTIKDVLPPLGVIVEEGDLDWIQDKNFVLEPSNSYKYNSKILNYPILPDIRILSIYFKKFLELNKRNGLGILNTEIHGILKRKFYPATLNEVGNLINRIITTSDINDLRLIIGRGEGLTPSGDDFFVGFLASLFANNYFDEDFHEVKQELVRNIHKYTTDIGADYIIKALRGEFSQNIIRLVNYIQLNIYDEKSLKDLVQHGETSGVDTFLGVVAGYVSLNNNLQIYREEKIV